MRTLQVSKFFPPVMGGIEAVAWELAEGLNRSGVVTNVLCSSQRAPGITQVSPSGYVICRAAALGRVLSTSVAPTMAWHLGRMASHADVVHVHMPDPMAAIALYLSRPRAKVVVHWHSDVIRQRMALRLYEPLQNWVLARADAVIATSPSYLESSVALQAWRDKVTIVPIGISDNHTSACSLMAATIRQRYRNRRVVFALGRMTYYKGFDVLIDAAARLPDDSVVVIGGDGELLDHYRSVVTKRGLAGKVHLLGHIPDHELASHFEACDVFCMPSTVRSEAYGVAIVEAMVMSKPVVASDILGSGVPWVNCHGLTGLNVPPRDPQALAEALTNLLSDDDLRVKMGEAARKRYEDEFGAALMTKRTLELYRRLLPV